jgi:hypothetical protein
MPTKDSADKRSSQRDEESTWKAAVFSCVAAWQLGFRSRPRPCRYVHPNLFLPLRLKCHSSTRLEANSSASWQV